MKPLSWALWALGAGAVGVTVWAVARREPPASSAGGTARQFSLLAPVSIAPAGVQAVRMALAGGGGIVVPTQLPPPAGSTVPIDRESERRWNELMKDYESVPVIGPMFVEVLQAIASAVGFATSTADRDLDDMRKFDAWDAQIADADAVVFAQVQAFAARLADVFGALPVLRAAIDTDEHITAASIVTGAAQHLAHPWFTAEGWQEWRDLLWADLPPLPLPAKGWQKYMKARGNKNLRITELRALGAIERFQRILGVVAR